MRDFISRYARSPDTMTGSVINVAARRLGAVSLHDLADSDPATFQVKVTGVRPDEGVGHIHGEIGTNPATTINIVVSDDPGIPVFLTMPIPEVPSL